MLSIRGPYLIFESWCRGLIKKEQGSIAIMTAFALPVFIGFGALAYEVGYWYQTQQKLQQVADLSAYGGALELSIRGPDDVTDRAVYLASINNFTEDDGTGTISVSTPPTSGDFTGDENAVEVILTKTLQRSLSRIFSSAPVTVQARAVASLSGGPACIYALNKTASGAFSVNGTVDMNSPNCGIAVNSASDSSVTGVGNASITTNYIKTAGGPSITSNVSVNTDSGNIQTYVPASPNPLSNLTAPSYSACDNNNISTKPKDTDPPYQLSPGVYCNGLKIGGQGTTKLNPGTYIIDGGDLSLGAGATLEGTGVTIILSGQISGTYATIKFDGGGKVTLTPPTTGPYAHITIFQDPNAPSGGSNSILGNASSSIGGIIYIPNQSVTFGGNGSATSPCSFVVADTIELKGTANFTCNPGDLGGYIQPSTLALVE